MTERADPRLARHLGWFAAGTSLLTMGAGVAVLVGWWLRIAILKTGLPGRMPMRANAAVGLVLIGAGLWLQRKPVHESPGGLKKRLGQALGVTAALLGTASLAEHLFNWNLGIDELLFSPAPEDILGSLRPALMSPIAALCLLFLGCALVLLDWRTRGNRWPVQWLAFFSGIAATFGMLNFILDSPVSHIRIAVHAALTFFVFSFGLVCARTEWGLGALLASSTLGGSMLRRLFPAAVIVPMLIGWLRWKEYQADPSSEWTGVSLMTVLAMVLMAGMTLWTAGVIDRTDSERQEVSGELRASEERYRLLLDGVKDYAVCMLDPDGRVASWNRGAASILGYEIEEIVGRSFSVFYRPEDRAAGHPERELKKAMAQGRAEEQGQRVRKDGTAFWANIVVAPVYDGGKLLGFSKVVRDITERKRAEEALRTERQRFSDVLDVLPPYVVLLTPDYHVRFTNRVFRQRFGEPNGKRCYEFLFNRNQPCEICETYKVLKTNMPGQWKWTGPDGRQYEIFDFPFTDADGAPLILEMGIDITEREQAEAEVRRLNAELEQRVLQRTAQLEAANKELEAFTYSVSHDLRAPLRHIGGFSRILLEEFNAGLGPDAQHYLQRIQDGTRRMGQLVDDLLNLARVGRHEPRLQVSGLNSLVEEVISDLKPEYEGRQVEWKVGSLPFVECDPALMKQVFQNLLSNALKFTRPRACAQIEIGQSEGNGQPTVFVRDNGVGFSMKYADKLFGIFQRLHRAEDFEGTGVGLATVHRIVQKHGGRIWAEAELDKGATFSFTLGVSKNTELSQAATAGDQS